MSLDNKGIRDTGSTADFRILFEILKFKNSNNLENVGIFKKKLEYLENFEKFLKFGKI